MTELDESAESSPAEGEAEQSLTELLEQLGRELSALAACEARLAASRHKPALLRLARDAAAAAVVALALLSAFVLANVAAVRALSSWLPDWAAPLLLAAAWTVVAVLLALFLRGRALRVTGWDVDDAEAARAEAGRAVLETLERLSPVITREIALAAVPAAGDMAEGVMDAGSELIENADEIVEALTEDVPGGGVVNQMWDVVLMPGRLGIRVATTVLRRGTPGS